MSASLHAQMPPHGHECAGVHTDGGSVESNTRLGVSFVSQVATEAEPRGGNAAHEVTQARGDRRLADNGGKGGGDLATLASVYTAQPHGTKRCRFN